MNKNRKGETMSSDLAEGPGSSRLEVVFGLGHQSMVQRKHPLRRNHSCPAACPSSNVVSPVWSMEYAVWSMEYAVCSMEYTECRMSFHEYVCFWCGVLVM
jgi:hypothetical protein